MNGTALLALLSSILSGENIDPTYALSLINIERNVIERSRPWTWLKAMDSSQIIPAGSNGNQAFVIPTNFRRYISPRGGAGVIQLVGASGSVTHLTEVPFESQLEITNSFGSFWADYGAMNFFVPGNVPGPLTAYQFFIQNSGDITLATVWNKIPADFHPILAFRAAVRYRLGTDYDDMNQRNADDNWKTAESIRLSMVEEDNILALGSVENIDYGNRHHRLGLRGK